MIERNVGENREDRRDDVRRIEPSAQANLDNRKIDA